MHKSSLFLTFVFLGLVCSVPVTQGIYEYLHNQRIQVFTIFEDSFITPHKRRQRIRQSVAQVHRCGIKLYERECTDIGDSLYEYAENMLAEAENARRYYIELNRYIRDSPAPKRALFDSLITVVQEIGNAIDSDDTIQITQHAAYSGKLSRELIGQFPQIHGVGWIISSLGAILKTTLFNRTYLRAYEADLEEHSVIAGYIRPVVQFARYRILADYGEKVIPGKHGWLFYRPGVEYCYRPSVFDNRAQVTDYNDTSVVDNPIECIVDFRNQLSEKQIDLLIVVIPGKPSIYPDYLCGNRIRTSLSDITPTHEFIDTLRAHSIDVVNLFDVFNDERKNDGETAEHLYLSQDTHWKYRGIHCAVQMVSKRIKTYHWFHEPHVSIHYRYDTLFVKREGDISVMTNLSLNPLKSLQVLFPKESTRCIKVLEPVTGNDGSVVEQIPYRDDFKHARILLIGDSFSRIYQSDTPGSAGFIAHLAAQLSEPMASLVSDGGASTLVREKLARNTRLLRGKRLVIWEFVERDIRFGAFGWKKIQLP